MVVPTEEIGTSSHLGTFVHVGGCDVLEPGGDCSRHLPRGEIGTSGDSEWDSRDAAGYVLPTLHDDTCANASLVCAASELCGGMARPIRVDGVVAPFSRGSIAVRSSCSERRVSRCHGLEGVVSSHCGDGNHDGNHEQLAHAHAPTLGQDTTMDHRTPKKSDGMKKVKKDHGTKKESTGSEPHRLAMVERDRQRLRDKLQLVRYELELLTAGGGLSQQEDAALRVRALEDGYEDIIRPSVSSKFSRPCAPEGMYTTKELAPTKNLSGRLAALETAARSLTSLSMRSDAALWKLHAKAMEEQLQADDAISRCAPSATSISNPHCEAPSERPLVHPYCWACGYYGLSRISE